MKLPSFEQVRVSNESTAERARVPREAHPPREVFDLLPHEMRSGFEVRTASAVPIIGCCDRDDEIGLTEGQERGLMKGGLYALALVCIGLGVLALGGTLLAIGGFWGTGVGLALWGAAL